MCWFFGRWRFLTNGDHHFVGVAFVFGGLGLLVIGLRRWLLGVLVVEDDGVIVVGVDLLICLCVHL